MRAAAGQIGLILYINGRFQNQLFINRDDFATGNLRICKSSSELIGSYQNITITGSTTWSLTGELA